MTFDRTMFIAAAITAALTATAQAQQAQPYGKTPQATQPGMTPQATQPGMTQTQPSPSGQAAPGAAAAVSDREIQAFASASNQIKQIKQKWHPQVTAAAKEGPQAQEKLERQAYAEMTSVVEKSGLTVDKYNQIAQLAQSNPDVQRKLERQQNPQRTQ